jgi:hypothetical protein
MRPKRSRKKNKPKRNLRPLQLTLTPKRSNFGQVRLLLGAARFQLILIFVFSTTLILLQRILEGADRIIESAPFLVLPSLVLLSLWQNPLRACIYLL